MFKLVKWGEGVVPVGPTFEGNPLGFKPSTSPSDPKPATHSRKAHMLVITERFNVVKPSVLHNYKNVIPTEVANSVMG